MRTAPKPQPCTCKVRTVKPAHGVCSLRLKINGTTYRVRPIDAEAFGAVRAFRLTKADSITYDVVEFAHGDIECDCPSFVFDRDGKDRGGCKHIASMRAVGLLGKGGAA